MTNGSGLAMFGTALLVVAVAGTVTRSNVGRSVVEKNPEVSTTAAGVQSPTAQAVRVQTDSLRRETCRGGRLSSSGLTCTGATSSTRVAVIRRLANRIDSIAIAIPSAPPPPLVTDPSHRQYAAQVYYNSDRLYFPNPGVDTVTVCDVITDQQGARKLAWPPVRMRVLGLDSATFGLRGGNPLSVMCARAIAAAGLTSADSLPVEWHLIAFQWQGRTIYRPFTSVP